MGRLFAFATSTLVAASSFVLVPLASAKSTEYPSSIVVLGNSAATSRVNQNDDTARLSVD